MKKICISLLLLFPLITYAQVSHELKMDVVQGLLSNAFVSYEVAPAKNYGIELGIGYKWDKIGFFSGMPDPTNLQSFYRNLGQLYLAGKLYPMKGANADLLFLGLFFLEEYELYRDPRYDQAYLEALGVPATLSKNSRTALGGTFGGKKIFKNGLLVEVGYTANVNLAYLFVPANQRTLDMGGSFNIKVGYRFPGHKAVENVEK